MKRRPRGYWTLERVLKTCNQILNEKGDLPPIETFVGLKRYRGLRDAIREVGGIRLVREKLGIVTVEKPTKEELEELYCDKKRNTVQIGKMYRVSPSTISKWMVKYNIEARSFAEIQLRPGSRLPTKEELENLYVTQGMSAREIGKIYGLSGTGIISMLKRDKFRIKSQAEIRLKGVALPTKEELERLYWKENLNIKQISERCLISRGTVSNLMKEYSIRGRTITEIRLKGVALPTKEELERLYWKENLNIKQISEKYKRPVEAIAKQLEEFGIRKRAVKARLKGVALPTKEELERLYWTKGLSTIKIGEEYKVSSSTIGNLMKKYQIETRSNRPPPEEGPGSLLERYIDEDVIGEIER